MTVDSATSDEARERARAQGGRASPFRARRAAGARARIWGRWRARRRFAPSIRQWGQDYVVNNPLNYVDPSGFDGEPPKPPILPTEVKVTVGPDGVTDIHMRYPTGEPRPPTEPDKGKDKEAAQVGAKGPNADTDTTGSTPGGNTAEPAGPEEDWRDNGLVQFEGGFFSGLLLGFVPFAGAGEEVLTEAEVLPRGTPTMRTGLAIGMIVGGLYTMASGVTGEVLGGAATVTGIGASVGLPAMAISATLVVGGAANVLAGWRGLTQSLSTGSGSGGPTAGKSPPNPHGKLGGPEHRAKVAEVKAEVEARGLDPKCEHPAQTPDGSKPVRYVDVVGRCQPKCGRNVPNWPANQSGAACLPRGQGTRRHRESHRDTPHLRTTSRRKKSAMSHQINYYCLLEDFAEIEAKIRRIEPLVILYDQSPTVTPRVADALDLKDEAGGRWLSYYLVRELDLAAVGTKYIPTQGYWRIEDTHSPVIECGGCFFDGKILRRDRMYYTDGYYDSKDWTTWIEKPEGFRRWAAAVFRATKKCLRKLDWRYIGPAAAKWLETSGGKLVDM